jgi:hypothetical protein
LFPAKFLKSVHQCEIKEVSASGLIYQVSIKIEAVKIFIEVRQLGLSGVRVGAIGALFTYLKLLVHYQVFDEVLVAITKLARDGLGEPSVLFLFVGVKLFAFIGILLRVGKKPFVKGVRCNAIRNLEVVVLNDEAAPGKIEIGLTVVDSLAKLLSD